MMPELDLHRLPRANRPLKALLVAAGRAVESDAYLSQTQDEFVGTVLRASGGSVNPARVRQLYHDLMADAGLRSIVKP